MIKLISRSKDDTLKLGKAIGRAAGQGDIICLNGDLGSGKTIISKGIAAGLGVKDMVTSPTFALMNSYEGRYPVFHFDIYRLNSPDELYDIDYEEYFYGDGVTIVEWPVRMGSLLPDQFLGIDIIKTEDDSVREIMIIPVGDRYNRYLEVLKSI